VARSARKTLLEAAFVTRIGEDVLTEMLAHVLVTDDDVTAGVAEAVGLDGEKWRAERVSTQESTPEGRVDLTMSLVNDDGEHLVWIEVKAGALEQPKQLERYARELRERIGRGTLVALAEAGDPLLRRAREQGLAAPLSWQQVLDLCTRVAEDRDLGDGREWRRRARSSEAPARQRTLAEFCWYLERRRVAVNIEAVTDEDVIAAARTERLLIDGGTIDQLLLSASAGLAGFARGETYSTSGSGDRIGLERGLALTPTEASASWLVEQRAVAELWFSTAGYDELGRDVEGEPSFYTGFTFAAPVTPAVAEALRNPAWQKELPDGVFVAGVEGWGIWLVSARSLSELARAGDSFADQAAALATWCEESLRAIGGAHPPPGWPTA
jgi:hypothetical protein